nr:transporter substrate-binding domain-containing protein [Oscillospiraceae bacterium]
GTRRWVILAGIGAAVLLAAILVPYLILSGAFRSEPQVEVFADNCYQETLHVVTDIDYEPFSYLDKDGNYAGLDVELIAEIANRLEMNLDFELLDWSAVQERFLRGEADVILNMETDSVAADPRMIATIPIVEKQYVVYGRKQISSVAELYGARVASLHRMPELGLDSSIRYLDSYQALFHALRDGDCDYVICPIQVGNVFLHKLNIRDVRSSYAVGHIYGAIALAPENEALRDRINEVIHDLQLEGFLDALDNKWISNRYQSFTLVGVLRARPWLGALGLGLLLLAAMVGIVAHTKDAYNRQLRKNLDTIQRQSEELREARNRAEASSRAKTTFLFNMSHDIRTPMNAIIGYTDLAERESNDLPTVREYLKKIGISSRHLMVLLNDILEMSRIESGKLKLEIAEADLVKTMDEVRDMYAAQMQEKRIRYRVTAGPLKDRRVLCDEARLIRVLVNLISNAHKFTPEGGQVSVSLRQTGAAEGVADYELRVKDNGIGMSPEFAARVFEPFERERTSTDSGMQGAGLGMTITKHIVERMNGSLRVETEQGRGTEVILQLRFPIAETPETAEAPEAAEPGDEVDFSGIRILLVEDNEINCEIATMLLEELGFVVDSAGNGKIAVEKLSASRPGDYRFILMDIQMPVMNGYEATKIIRGMKDEGFSDIPIIAMTANTAPEDIETQKRLGMNDLIGKPIDMDTMLRVLSKFAKT